MGSIIPPEFDHIPRCEKPIAPGVLAKALVGRLGATADLSRLPQVYSHVRLEAALICLRNAKSIVAIATQGCSIRLSDEPHLEGA